MEALTLGQLGDRTDEGVWLFIHPNGGLYVTWGEGEDEEYREMLAIRPEKRLPRIQVRRWMNPDQEAHQRKARKKFQRIGEIPPAVQDKLLNEAVAHTVLIGWEGIATPGSGPEPYTPELGIEALKADPVFREAVLAAAMESQRFRDTSLAEDSDALGKSSSGSSSGDHT